MASSARDRRCAVALVVCLLLAAEIGTAQGQQAEAGWPHLRGPSYDGVSRETGLSQSWPEGGPPVLWRIDLGQGYSAFSAANGRLYTMDQSRSAQYVVCVDANTGREIWRRRADWPWRLDVDYQGPRATPTIQDGRVYFAGAYGLVGCLDALTGREIWSVNVTETFRGEGTEYGYSCSPLVMDGKVFLPVGGKGASVVALDAKDGSRIWGSGDEVASYSSCLPIAVNGRRQVVASMRNVTAAFDPATGRRLWEHRWSVGYDEHTALPLYEEPYLLVASSFRMGSRAFRLEADGQDFALRPVWDSKALSNDLASSIVVHGHVYGFDLHDMQPDGERPVAGEFKCIELATGKVRWSTGRTGMATVLAADGKLILFNETGELILVRETPERYTELGRAKIFAGEFCSTAPALYRGRLYVRAHTQAACVYLGPPGGLKTPATSVKMPNRRSPRYSIWRGTSLVIPWYDDIFRWFLYSLVGVIGASLVLAWAADRFAAEPWARFAFYAAAFVLGIAGTFLFSRLAGRFIYTWPVALFVACHLALVAALRSKEEGRRGRWLSLAATLVFAGLCVGYFAICRDLFLVAGYGFLTGLVIAMPVLVIAAMRAHRTRRLAGEVVWVLISFSAFFWASGLFTIWRTRL